MKSTPVAYGFLVLALLCVVIAVLYVIGGILPTFTSSGAAGPHFKHAILFGVLAVASLVAFNFTRPRTV
ncbi:MAG TPA: hypothetical protein VJT78_09795 [Candidatus Dormibacteraeota bacterium]|nr:hypothetical protein [Candidatus Dormibacteraeota bacterium]